VETKHLPIIINESLYPWNAYGNINSPDLKTPLNVIIKGKEWYNSYMPPFFDLDLQGIQLIKEIKTFIDSGTDFKKIFYNEDLGKKYLLYIKNILSSENKVKTIDSLFQRVSDYFNVVEKYLVSIEVPDFSAEFKVDVLIYLYIALNMMQLYMDPVEAFITGKSMQGVKLKDSLFKSKEHEALLLEKCVPLDIAFIPLAVLFNLKNYSKKDDEAFTTVFDYMASALFCTSAELEFGLENANKEYNYSHYLSVEDAQKIVDSVNAKIIALDSSNRDLMLLNKIQLLNSCMTWSKYIPLQLEPLRFRYYSTNNILLKIKQEEWIYNFYSIEEDALDTVSNSGAEKQGKLFFLLNSIFNQDVSLKVKVIKSRQTDEIVSNIRNMLY